PNQSDLPEDSGVNISESAALTCRMGMAKPIPCASDKIATFKPMSSPRKLTSGPPRLPGLMEASVCNQLGMSNWSFSLGAVRRLGSVDLDPDFVGPAHDVIVGEHVPLLINDDAGAEAQLGIRRLTPVIGVEELSQQIIERVVYIDDGFRGDIYHGGHDLLHGGNRRVPAHVGLRGLSEERLRDKNQTGPGERHFEGFPT